MRRFLGLLAICSVLCSATASAAQISIGLAADVSSLDPHYLDVAPNIAMSAHFFDTLVEVDGAGRLIPGLATSWRNVDSRTWEFQLRKGVRFHDGSPFTADDVLFSLDRPATIVNSPGPFTSFTKPIITKRVVDPYTVRLTTAQPYGPLPLDLSSIFIVSRKAATGASSEDFNTGRALVGTGPFKLLRFRRGESIEMVRNEQYWGEKPVWDKASFRILSADAPRLAALLSGQVDAIEAAPAADLARLRIDPRFRLEQRVSWRTLFLQMDIARDKSPFMTDANGLPLDRNPLRDGRVRLALSKAIDRTALAARTMENLAIPAANLVSPGILGYNDQLKPETHDPDGARRLLREAGYPEGFGLTLHGPNNRYINDDQILQTVAQFFTRIGVRTRVQTMPLSAYFGRLRKAEFSTALLGWGSLAGDFAMRSLLATPDPDGGWGTWNWGGYSNPQADQLLRAALASTDQSKRAELAREAARLALRDTAVIPLHHQVATWAMRGNLAYAARIDEFTFAHQFKPR